MNRDGFSLLVMGFTGSKALEWKLKFIQAFNEMENALREKAALPKISPQPHYKARMVKTAIRDMGGTAASIQEVFGAEEGMAMATAMEMIGELYGINTEPLKKYLPAAKEAPGRLNATNLAERVGLFYKTGRPNGQKANSILESLGLQKKNAKKEWNLTEKGRKYGETVAYTRKGHGGYQPLWKEKVIPLIKRAIDAEDKGVIDLWKEDDSQ